MISHFDINNATKVASESAGINFKQLMIDCICKAGIQLFVLV